MKIIDQVYINGQFKKPQGTETFDLINPATKEKFGKVVLGNEKDIQEAVLAAKVAFKNIFENNN